MIENKNVLIDNEYNIMSEIADNEKISQRELSRKLGVSVSTVNVLINKMCREGLIKMTQISPKQVLYILTPLGMLEKAKKTVSYLKIHYKAICEIKEKIKRKLSELDNTYDQILVLLNDGELSEILNIAVNEFKVIENSPKIIVTNNHKEFIMRDNKKSILIHMDVNRDELIYFLNNYDCDIISLLDEI